MNESGSDLFYERDEALVAMESIDHGLDSNAEDDPDDDRPFELKIDLNVLDHLGINLYSNLPAVLTEVVANAWDADARKVDIDIQDEHIVIVDDGHGMTHAEIRNRYLRVGYRRRNQLETAKSRDLKRPVMGRKGLGKLAVFSIAREVELHSVADGQRCGLLMKEEDIRAAMSEGRPYLPVQINEGEINLDGGTRIILRNLKRERLRRDDLRARLARRFSVIGGADFLISVDGSQIGEGDRRELDSLQFVWRIGDTPIPGRATPTNTGILPDRLDVWTDTSWKVRGWLATVHSPSQLKLPPDNLNSIVVLARGRLFQENVLDKLNDGRFYTKYLTGYIEADFLDSDDRPDIATSDRQRVIEDDDRYQAVLAYLRSISGRIVSDWDEWRIQTDHEAAVTETPALREWLGQLTGGYRRQAESLVARIHKLSENRDEKKILYRHAMLGFERLKLTGGTHELSDALAAGPDVLLRLLADRDTLEACLYRDIVHNRLDVIRAFETQVGDNEREKVLQQYLFEHLWLLDPSWERASGSEILEKPINDEFDRIEADLTEEEQRGRVDIKYRSVAGQHVIIELKRAARRVSVTELVAQGKKYRDALRKCLRDVGRDNEPCQVIFVIGNGLSDADDPEYVSSQLSSIKAQIVTYHQLIERARQGYAAYLDRTRELDSIERIVEQL